MTEYTSGELALRRLAEQSIKRSSSTRIFNNPMLAMETSIPKDCVLLREEIPVISKIVSYNKPI